MENNYKSLILTTVGLNLDYSLFKTAIFYAEQGLHVWYISPRPFDKIPQNIQPPEKEVLQLITFVYLSDFKRLITHLNKIHLWRKIPTAILVAKFEKYVFENGNSYNAHFAGMAATTLLDAVQTCGNKLKKKCFLVLTCDLKVFNSETLKKFKILQDMYFVNVINNCDDCEQTFDKIVDYF